MSVCGTGCDEGPVLLWPLQRWDSMAWLGAEEGEDGQHPAVLVGRLGEAEFLEDLGDMGLHGAFGDVQPGGDGPVGHALGDQPEDLSFPLAEGGQRVLPAASADQALDDRRVDHRLPSTIRRRASTTVAMSNTRPLSRGRLSFYLLPGRTRPDS
jgi:hypothetical protein